MERELVDFLESIDCRDAIPKMEEEKLSMLVIHEMKECDLVPFMRRFGDRISLKMFVEEELKKKKKASGASTGKSRSTLVKHLRAKLGIVNDKEMKQGKPKNDTTSSSDDSDNVLPKLKRRKKGMARKGNRNALKDKRKVELGWIHQGKQVRTAKGGGTRKVELFRRSKKNDILAEAKSLFFPNGMSPVGGLCEFTFTLTDFSQREIGEETLEELYNATKLPLLRLYMISETKLTTANADPPMDPNDDQDTVGLQTCNLLQNLQDHPDLFHQVFVKSSNEPVVDAVTFGGYFQIHESSWSLPGHHRRAKEEKTHTFWRDFLQDLEEEEKLSLLLKFVTGLEVMPPLGINPQPTLTFGHSEDLEGDHTASFPMANTCGNILRIPVLNTYELFHANCLSAIEMVNVFTTE